MSDQSPVKVGRNDPCPCGSGKKYKKCCLSEQSVVDNSPAAQIYNALARLLDELFGFLTRRFRDDLMAAWSDFQFTEEEEEIPPAPGDEHEFIFMAFALLHWDPDAPGRTTNLAEGGIVARTVLKERSLQLGEMERQILEILMRQPFSFYELISWSPGQEFLMRELWTGEEIEVAGLSSAEQMTVGEIVYALMLPMPGATVIACVAPLAVLAEMKPGILACREMLRQELRGGPRELTFDDLRDQQDDLRELYFEILAGPDEDEYEDDEDEYEKEDDEDEDEYVEYDDEDDVEDEAEADLREVRDMKAEALRNPEMREKIREILQEKVDDWPNQHVPALGNKTPLEAVKDAKGRKGVESLLADYEQTLQQNFEPSVRPTLDHVRKLLDV